MSSLFERIRRMQPGYILGALDVVGLLVVCALTLAGYSTAIPVPQLGIVLVLFLLVVLVAWAVTRRDVLLDVHYMGALVALAFGVVYEVYTRDVVTILPMVVWCGAFLGVLLRTHRMRDIHPGLILAALDVVGLLIAGYLSSVELGGGVPSCGASHGCETVAMSSYARVGGIPVAVFGVILSITLLTLAIAWVRSDKPNLLDVHYGLSLVGVIFEVYFIAVQAFILRAVCIWCVSYGVSLILRFLVALAIWIRRGRLNVFLGRE